MRVLPYVTLYLIPAVTSLALAVYGWRQRRHTAARPFSLLMVALVFWSVCHALSVGSATFEGALRWAQIQYGGIVFVPPLWLLFALAYANRWPRAIRAVCIGLVIPAVLAYIAVLTNDQHHLWWTSVEPDRTHPFVAITVTRGVLFWIHTIYTYVCILAGLVLFIRTMHEVPALYRRQAQLVLAGALIPLAGNILHLLGLRINAVDDPTPFLLAACGLVTFYAVFRYRLLNLAPIAQREIFESMPDGVVVLDSRGIVVAINDPAPGLLCVPTSAWVGRVLFDLLSGSPLAAHLREMLLPPAPQAERRAIYKEDDGLHGVEIRVRPLFNGQVRAGSLLVLHDITEQARVAQALDQRVADLTLLNQIARTANTALQTEGLLRLISAAIARSVDWDRVVISLLEPDGATLRLVIDQPLDGAAPLEGYTLALNEYMALRDLLQTGQTRTLHINDPAIPGTPAEALMRRLSLCTVLIVPLYSQDEPLGVLFLGHTDPRTVNADERRLFETVGKLISETIVRTRLYEEAQQASNLKSAFLATVSHELRTPLTSIIGYTDMLRQGIFGPLPDRIEEPLGSVRHSSQTLLRLINDILDFSKMEAGHLNITLHPVDVASVVESVADLMQPQIYERGLTLQIDLAPDLPLVFANSARLEQVLTNLLSNAIKFTDTGTITVRAAQNGDRVRLSVQDTGIGISPEEQRELFQVFRQIENAHTRRFGGTGLGLAISRRLTDLMGGDLWLKSAPGAGSTFYCDLRLTAADGLKEAMVPLSPMRLANED